MGFDWLSAGVDLLGGILGKSASSAMDLKASKELIQEQLKAQKDLFQFENQNKHQFEIGDLKTAGLNPILSATNGSAIGVGGVSAPNWSSDDDIFSPASARALQRDQIRIADKQAIAQLLNAEANLHNARTGGDRNSAEALYFDEKAETERQTRKAQVDKIVSDAVLNTNLGKKALSDANEIVSRIPVNINNAKKLAAETTGFNMTNEQALEINELLKSGNYDEFAFRKALAYKMMTKAPWHECVAFAASVSAIQKLSSIEKNPNEIANSGLSAFDNQVKYMVD